jgi:putative addiction module component (TIGR02574 family)
MAIDPEELRSLPIPEKLRLVEQLWDQIAAADDRSVLQPWHEEETQKRVRELERNPEIALTREELWKRVGEGHG